MTDSMILATNNTGKIHEFQSILPDVIFKLQADLNIQSVAETGTTFVENALIKARNACQFAKMPAIADDSGLVVPALKGQPGIYSARFAGEGCSDEDNINKLIKTIKHNLNYLEYPSSLKAYFYCIVVSINHENDPTPVIGSGKLYGQIQLFPKGKNGFGYDPIFYLPEYQCTLAELNSNEKNSISHRGQAIQDWLERCY